jgi:predicted kinase
MNTASEFNRPIAIILIGLPGAGKSTFASTCYPSFGRISTDKYIEQAACDQQKSYSEVFPTIIDTAVGKMRAESAKMITNGENIIWDQTNLTSDKRREMIQQLKSSAKSYRIVAVVLSLDDDVRKARVTERKDKLIPSHVLTSMEKSYQPPTLEEGFDEIRTYSSEAKDGRLPSSIDDYRLFTVIMDRVCCYE